MSIHTYIYTYIQEHRSWGLRAPTRVISPYQGDCYMHCLRSIHDKAVLEAPGRSPGGSPWHPRGSRRRPSAVTGGIPRGSGGSHLVLPKRSLEGIRSPIVPRGIQLPPWNRVGKALQIYRADLQIHLQMYRHIYIYMYIYLPRYHRYIGRYMCRYIDR